MPFFLGKCMRLKKKKKNAVKAKAKGTDHSGSSSSSDHRCLNKKVRGDAVDAESAPDNIALKYDADTLMSPKEPMLDSTEKELSISSGPGEGHGVVSNPLLRRYTTLEHDPSANGIDDSSPHYIETENKVTENIKPSCQQSEQRTSARSSSDNLRGDKKQNRTDETVIIGDFRPISDYLSVSEEGVPSKDLVEQSHNVQNRPVGRLSEVAIVAMQTPKDSFEVVAQSSTQLSLELAVQSYFRALDERPPRQTGNRRFTDLRLEYGSYESSNWETICFEGLESMLASIYSQIALRPNCREGLSLQLSDLSKTFYTGNSGDGCFEPQIHMALEFPNSCQVNASSIKGNHVEAIETECREICLNSTDADSFRDKTQSVGYLSEESHDKNFLTDNLGLAGKQLIQEIKSEDELSNESFNSDVLLDDEANKSEFFREETQIQDDISKESPIEIVTDDLGERENQYIEGEDIASELSNEHCGDGEVWTDNFCIRGTDKRETQVGDESSINDKLAVDLGEKEVVEKLDLLYIRSKEKLVVENCSSDILGEKLFLQKKIYTQNDGEFIDRAVFSHDSGGVEEIIQEVNPEANDLLANQKESPSTDLPSIQSIASYEKQPDDKSVVLAKKTDLLQNDRKNELDTRENNNPFHGRLSLNAVKNLRNLTYFCPRQIVPSEMPRLRRDSDRRFVLRSFWSNEINVEACNKDRGDLIPKSEKLCKIWRKSSGNVSESPSLVSVVTRRLDNENSDGAMRSETDSPVVARHHKAYDQLPVIEGSIRKYEAAFRRYLLVAEAKLGPGTRILLLQRVGTQPKLQNDLEVKDSKRPSDSGALKGGAVAVQSSKAADRSKITSAGFYLEFAEEPMSSSVVEDSNITSMGLYPEDNAEPMSSSEAKDSRKTSVRFNFQDALEPMPYSEANDSRKISMGFPLEDASEPMSYSEAKDSRRTSVGFGLEDVAGPVSSSESHESRTTPVGVTFGGGDKVLPSSKAKDLKRYSVGFGLEGGLEPMPCSEAKDSRKTNMGFSLEGGAETVRSSEAKDSRRTNTRVTSLDSMKVPPFSKTKDLRKTTIRIALGVRPKALPASQASNLNPAAGKNSKGLRHVRLSTNERRELGWDPSLPGSNRRALRVRQISAKDVPASSFNAGKAKRSRNESPAKESMTPDRRKILDASRSIRSPKFRLTFRRDRQPPPKDDGRSRDRDRPTEDRSRR